MSDNVMPVLYDENGLVVSSDLLEINQSTVTIRAEILATKNIPVRCQVSGEPASGYQYRGVEYAPETVLVKGEAAVLNNINAINIPADVINIDGANKDVEVSIDIMPYLQELGISPVDDTANQVAVKAIIERKATKLFNFVTKDIKITGLENRYELTYSAETVTINVRALEEDMDALKLENIEAILDVTGLEPGTYTKPLTVNLPGEKYELVGQVNVQITIVDKEAQEEEPEPGMSEGPIDEDEADRPNEEGEENTDNDDSQSD